MNLLDDVIQFEIKKDMGLYNLTDEFFCVFLKALLTKKQKNILLVVDSLFEANKIYNILNNLLKLDLTINFSASFLLIPRDII